MTEPTTPAGRDEHDHWHRVVGDACNDFRPHLCHHLSRVAAIEEQARAEGRREAVREIRANAESKGWRIDAYMNRILDEVLARHPEPAPDFPIASMVAHHGECHCGDDCSCPCHDNQWWGIGAVRAGATGEGETPARLGSQEGSE